MKPNTCELQNVFLNDNQISEYKLYFNESADDTNAPPNNNNKI